MTDDSAKFYVTLERTPTKEMEETHRRGNYGEGRLTEKASNICFCMLFFIRKIQNMYAKTPLSSVILCSSLKLAVIRLVFPLRRRDGLRQPQFPETKKFSLAHFSSLLLSPFLSSSLFPLVLGTNLGRLQHASVPNTTPFCHRQPNPTGRSRKERP